MGRLIVPSIVDIADETQQYDGLNPPVFVAFFVHRLGYALPLVLAVPGRLVLSGGTQWFARLMFFSSTPLQG